MSKLIGYACIVVGSALLAAGAMKLAQADLDEMADKKADDTWQEVTADAG